MVTVNDVLTPYLHEIAARNRAGDSRKPRSGHLCAAGCGARVAADAGYCQSCKLLAMYYRGRQAP